MAYQFYSKVTGSNSTMRKTSQTGWKNIPFRRAEIRDTDYTLQDLSMQKTNLAVNWGAADWGEQLPDHSRDSSSYARAYEKFRSKVYTQAANLTAIRERAKTIDMVVSRLSQIHKGAAALKKGNFKLFLRTFGIKAKPRHSNKSWTRPKDFGALWLEYWMGWAPTVADIYTSVEFLGKDVPVQTVRAGSRQIYKGSYKQSNFGAVATSSFTGFKTVWVQAKVILTNPTLFNLNGLGLINPAKTIWETIPFSWFVDWFTNIGQVLGQVTDWVGLQLKDLIVSWKTKADQSWVCTGYNNITEAPATAYKYRTFTWFTRECGGTLPFVKPIIRLPNGLSLTRGATLVSLIVQLFAPKKA